jgi:serine phosphatase RsbU (regulator of sigma subunit)
MVLYTDGITNTFNSKRRPFGLKRLKKTLSNSPEKPPQAFIDKVWEELATYRGSVDQYDDLTLFIVKAD